MKTAKLLLGAVLCIAISTATTYGQSVTRRGVSPVYIPGAQNYDSLIKPATTFSPVSTGNRSSSSSNSISGSSFNQNDGDSGYDSGFGSAGDCGCGTGCGSGCGCGSSDQVGNSFFGRLGDISPIKFNVTRPGDSCGCGSAGNCGCNNRTGLGRLIPNITIRTNACNKYVSFFGGYNDLEDFDGDGGGGQSRLVSFNDGWNLGFTRGRRFPNYWRFEAEFRIQHNTVDQYQLGNFVGMDFVPTATFDAQDSVYSISSMRNLIHDFNYFGTKTVPYLGVGIGGLYANGDIVTPGLGRADGINDWAFAYQLIAGFSRKISCQSEAYAEYRYFGTNGLNVETDASMAGPILSDEFDYQSNNVVFGVRITIPNSQGK